MTLEGLAQAAPMERSTLPEARELRPADARYDLAHFGLPSDDLDKPFFMTREARLELPPLSDQTRETMKDRGISDETIDAVVNEAEAKIYLDANLEPTVLNDREVLVRTDINLEQTDVDGATNLERMENGKAPLGQDGRPIELHHIGQKHDSALAELTPTEHREGDNFLVLHDCEKTSEIRRGDFDKERQTHWKARADQIHQARNGKTHEHA